MLFALSKIIPMFLFPAGLVILLCLAIAWLAFRKGARAAGWLAVATAVMFYGAAAPVVGNILVRSLEKRYPPGNEAAAKAIVLLGGGMSPLMDPRIHPETNAAGDRVLHAARLWKRGLAPVIVPTGGYITFLTDAPGTEADLYAQLLVDVFGIPSDAVIRMGRSRTTHEDALFTAALFDSIGMDKDILLVTSATHMTRAAALFRAQGFVVHPAPTDFRADRDPSFKFIRILPSGATVAETTAALHEYMGIVTYKLMGWM